MKKLKKNVTKMLGKLISEYFFIQKKKKTLLLELRSVHILNSVN